MRVLLVEDEPDLARALSRTLADEGWVVDWIGDGESALALARGGPHDVVVLDLMLPRIDGWQVLATLRREGYRTPILLLTARAAVDDRVRGLDAGADDYLTKPFAPDELLARIRALVRRAADQPDPDVTVGSVRIDTSARRVHGPGGELDLTAREYAILELLARRLGQVVTRTEISEALYDDDVEVMSNTIDVHIGSLRRKIGPGLIRTRRGLGYFLEP
jgi:two-component system OmpR family response regulator